jgi:uncharacterized protein YdcH (DUF465 family)
LSRGFTFTTVGGDGAEEAAAGWLFGLRAPRRHAMIHHAKARYPEHADTIEALSQTNSGFEELIHRYGHVVESLLGLGEPTGPDDLAETDDLRKRRAALEEEMLLAINSNRV